MGDVRGVLSSIGDRAEDLSRTLAAFDGERLLRWGSSLSQYQQLSQQVQLLLEKGSDSVLEHFVPEPVAVGPEPARTPQLLSTRLAKEQEEQRDSDARTAAAAASEAAAAGAGPEDDEAAVKDHNARVDAAYKHLAARAQALELPGAATLSARVERGGGRGAAASSAPAGSSALAAAPLRPTAHTSNRALAEAPLFRNGDRVRVCAATKQVHHLASGLRVPMKLVGDTAQCRMDADGEKEVVLSGIAAEEDVQLRLAHGRHLDVNTKNEWSLRGRNLVAGGGRSAAMAQPPPEANQSEVRWNSGDEMAKVADDCAEAARRVGYPVLVRRANGVAVGEAKDEPELRAKASEVFKDETLSLRIERSLPRGEVARLGEWDRTPPSGEWHAEGLAEPPRLIHLRLRAVHDGPPDLHRAALDLWWRNEWSLTAEFANLPKAEALLLALRPPPATPAEPAAVAAAERGAKRRRES